MKKQITIIVLMLISFSAFSQKIIDKPISRQNACVCVSEDSAHRAMGMVLNEEQMFKLYKALSYAKAGIGDAKDVSVFDATHLFIPFQDSLMNILVTQSSKWHPEAPPKTSPKTDSVQKK